MKTYKKSIPKMLLVSFVFTIILTGCETIESTIKYYTVLTPNPYPAKPENYLLPIIKEDQTRRSYKVIGQMEFQTGRSDSFIMKAVQYNGRIHGADAIILKKWEKQDNTYVSWDPGWYSSSYYSPYPCDYGRVWVGPFYEPPHYEVRHYITNKVKAEMIVFLDNETFGYLGFIFEDVRNADYLEIAKIVPGSPVEKAGLLTGDRVKKIGSYDCNKGLDDFHKNSPIWNVGKSYDVEYEREGNPFKTNVIAAKIPSI